MPESIKTERATIPIPPSSAPASSFVGNYRWVVCALLFFATTVNYIDRQILSLIKEILDKEIGWNNTQFGYVNSAFQLAYGIGLLRFGWVVAPFCAQNGCNGPHFSLG